MFRVTPTHALLYLLLGVCVAAMVLIVLESWEELKLDRAWKSLPPAPNTGPCAPSATVAMSESCRPPGLLPLEVVSRCQAQGARDGRSLLDRFASILGAASIMATVRPPFFCTKSLEDLWSVAFRAPARVTLACWRRKVPPSPRLRAVAIHFPGRHLCVHELCNGTQQGSVVGPLFRPVAADDTVGDWEKAASSGDPLVAWASNGWDWFRSIL